MIDVSRENNAEDWDAFVKDNGGHPLQLWGWGEVKARHGWRAERIRVGAMGAQLLVKRLPKPFGSFVYIPRGPFGNYSDEKERGALVQYVKRQYKPLVLSVEPDTAQPLRWKGWHKAKNTILLPRTAVIDLTKSDEELQAAMSKKTRQYIRKSAGEGIVVRIAVTHHDIAACMAIYKQTAHRAGFALHGDDYYQDIFDLLTDDSPVFMAEYQGRVVAFLWPIVTPEVSFELYGGMNDEGQALRANYHLKWQVVQWMKQRGVRRYDVNGLLNDGVSAFKKGFIPDETQLVGTYDMPLSPLYIVWNTWLPVAKRLARLLRR